MNERDATPEKVHIVRAMYGDEKLVEVVERHMFGHLFHLTDATHVPTIEKHGLLSARRARELGVAPAYPGGNRLTRSLDAERGLDNVVFLSFFNQGLMPNHEDTRDRNPVLLRIDAKILLRHGVKVALGRANRSRTVICKPGRAYHAMDWEVIFGNVDREKEKARYLGVLDYEVLVPHQLPVECILGAV